MMAGRGRRSCGIRGQARTKDGFHEGGEGAEARFDAVEEAAEDEADGNGGDHAVLLLQHHAHHIAQPRRVPHHSQRNCATRRSMSAQWYTRKVNLTHGSKIQQQFCKHTGRVVGGALM